MKASTIFLNTRRNIPARHVAKGCLAAVLLVLMGISSDLTLCRAQQPGSDAPGIEVLTRGPVHEAFAGMVTFNPEPGVVVTKAPPDVIEEMPPDVRPEGDNVTWIPGYWAWDDERNDFLWVSGTWRALPPGRAWIAGYWGQIPQGYQWTSGYWEDAAASETTYLPAPPATVEAGPTSKRLGWNTVGRRVAGFGIRGVMPGARVIGRKAGRIGIGSPPIMCGPIEDISSLAVSGIIR